MCSENLEAAPVGARARRAKVKVVRNQSVSVASLDLWFATA